MNVYPLTIRIRPSRRLAALVAAMHGVTAASFLASALPPYLRLVACLVLGLSLILSLRRAVPGEVVLGEDGLLRLAAADGRETDADPRGASTDFGWAVWLVWNCEAEKSSGAFMLLPDQMEPEEWRRLRIWMRLLAPRAVRA